MVSSFLAMVAFMSGTTWAAAGPLCSTVVGPSGTWVSASSTGSVDTSAGWQCGADTSYYSNPDRGPANCCADTSPNCTGISDGMKYAVCYCANINAANCNCANNPDTTKRGGTCGSKSDNAQYLAKCIPDYSGCTATPAACTCSCADAKTTAGSPACSSASCDYQTVSNGDSITVSGCTDSAGTYKKTCACSC